ncbi:cytadherence high molecular weight protein 2 isoform X2 [Drosophila innubila]|uniref:cytadherence high molecular weight protein 2 isoform X2 n=1 Tax=Drosophila innubila TaxID=198719 RepID=UPI00148D0F59|nr:cytadherence high molecular weight protein 2 isoform X2 [Drosophila innubila]
MDLAKMVPNNSVNRGCSQEDSLNINKAAVCPAQGKHRGFWRLEQGQQLLSAKNLSHQWCSSQETEPVASMKIFTSVMLNAWRRRRADVQRLQSVVEQLKTSSMEAKNELHVCSTLMRVEQKRCQNLQVELKQSTFSINQVRNSCEMLNTSVLSLKADKQQLEEDLSRSRIECGELRYQTNKSKDDLLAALLEQRNLQQLLSTEQRMVHQLTRENEQLLNDVNYLRNMESDFQRKEESYLQELKLKEDSLLNMSIKIKELERELNNRSRQNTKQWSCPMNEQKFNHDTNLSITPISSGFQLDPLRNNVKQFIKWYGIDQLYKKLHYYTRSTAYIIWIVLLPYKSLRNGCMPPKIRLTEV